MKAALLLGPERIALGDAAGPDLVPGEVMIEPQVAGICGTDISRDIVSFRILSSWGTKWWDV